VIARIEDSGCQSGPRPKRRPTCNWAAPDHETTRPRRCGRQTPAARQRAHDAGDLRTPPRRRHARVVWRRIAMAQAGVDAAQAGAREHGDPRAVRRAPCSPRTPTWARWWRRSRASVLFQGGRGDARRPGVIAGRGRRLRSEHRAGGGGGSRARSCSTPIPKLRYPGVVAKIVPTARPCQSHDPGEGRVPPVYDGARSYRR